MTPEEFYNAFSEFVGEHHGKSSHQDFFRAVHRQALKGMGLSNDADIQRSGEAGVLRYIQGEIDRRGVTDPVVFDAGANVGHYTAAVLDSFVGATVYSFEPSPTAFRSLLDVASRDPARCYPVNVGLSDKAGEGTLHTNSLGSGLASLYKRQLDQFGEGPDGSEPVRLETIDGFCAANGIGHIHFLKIDVEGHEIAVLNGACGMLGRRAIDFIQFEFGGCNIDSRTFLRDFWNRLDGFAICKILKDGLYKLTSYSESDEIFAYQNFLAIRL